MDLRRIIVGVDFSEEAGIAWRHAVNIAANTGAEIMLVHIVDVPPPNAQHDTTPGTPADEDAWLEAEIDAARQRLDDLSAQARHAGLTVTVHAEPGEPGVLLPTLAADAGAELLCVSTHGRTGYRRLLLGSVAESVVRRSKTNVLVTRPRLSKSGGYNHILVPTDFSDLAEHALEMAVTLVSAQGVIDVLHCERAPIAARGYATTQSTADYVEQLRDAVTKRGDELIEDFTKRHEKTNFIFREDAPSRAILQLLDDTAYDLVTMGSHGRRGLRRWIVGSVAENIVRHAPCSVLIVH